MEVARNPAMLQELMRNQDRAMSNLESLPGGQNALQRMYRDIQEPMLNAAQEQLSSNPFQALGGNNAGTAGQPATGENSAPLPNPWGGPGNAASTNPTTSTTSSSSATSSSLFTSPGMQSLLSQMTQNPQLMQNMMNAPYTQHMFESMSQNPDAAANIISSNPLFAGNQQLQDQMRNMMPSMLQQMQNPAVQGMMTNPESLQAIMQIQQGMQRLQSSAPDLYGSMGFPGVGVGMNMTSPPGGNSATSPSATTTGSTATSATSPTPNPAATPSSGANPVNPQGQQAYNQLMQQMMNSMAGQGNNSPPEERFRTQLETLAGMGFVDRQTNIQALMATFGDVNAAIDRLLNPSPTGEQS